MSVICSSNSSLVKRNSFSSFKLIITGTSETKSFDIAIRGDLNGDGDITILDLLKCQKHLLGSSKLTDVRFYAADTNYDGDITILDLLKIQKHILGSSKL